VLDPNAQIADAKGQQLLVFKCAPKWLWGLLHCFYRNLLELEGGGLYGRSRLAGALIGGRQVTSQEQFARGS
jgi:hypothetical protein